MNPDNLDLRLLAATNNNDKLREIRQILSGANWQVLGLGDFPPYPEPPEDGETLLENALAKAREGYNRNGLLTLADDTGLEIDALDGRPGVYSARYAGPQASYEDNVARVLVELKGIPIEKRSARFRCVMALVGDRVEKWWEGVTHGFVLENPVGSNGFGYDPVFWSPELNKTFAEAASSEKNRVSHRGRALTGLIAHLTDLNRR